MWSAVWVASTWASGSRWVSFVGMAAWTLAGKTCCRALAWLVPAMPPFMRLHTAHVLVSCLQYATWEEQQKDFRRARSVWERALDVSYRNVTVWLKVGNSWDMQGQSAQQESM